MRVSRTEVVNTIMMNLGCVQQQVNIEETPEILRHSCVNTGITGLQCQYFPVPSDEIPNLTLPFYFCPKCGKLYVYRHLYD